MSDYNGYTFPRPCDECEYEPKDGESVCPNWKTCARWQMWFRREWKTIREKYKRREKNK